MIDRERIPLAEMIINTIANRPGAQPKTPEIPKSVAEVADNYALTTEEAGELLVELGLLYLRDHTRQAHKLLCALAITPQKATE